MRNNSINPNLETKVGDINFPNSLNNAFLSSAIIINCAGPYLDTAEEFIQSALSSLIVTEYKISRPSNQLKYVSSYLKQLQRHTKDNFQPST